MVFTKLKTFKIKKKLAYSNEVMWKNKRRKDLVVYVYILVRFEQYKWLFMFLEWWEKAKLWITMCILKRNESGGWNFCYCISQIWVAVESNIADCKGIGSLTKNEKDGMHNICIVCTDVKRYNMGICIWISKSWSSKVCCDLVKWIEIHQRFL